MTTEDKRLSNTSSASGGVGQDMATSVWSSPSPTISPSKDAQDSRARAYRKHIRKESQAREREQHDALYDNAATAVHTSPMKEGRATAVPDQDSPTKEASSSSSPNTRGFGKILQKMGLKK